MRRLKALENSAVASTRLALVYERKGEREHLLAMARECRLAKDENGFKEYMAELKAYNNEIKKKDLAVELDMKQAVEQKEAVIELDLDSNELKEATVE